MWQLLKQPRAPTNLTQAPFAVVSFISFRALSGVSAARAGVAGSGSRKESRAAAAGSGRGAPGKAVGAGGREPWRRLLAVRAGDQPGGSRPGSQSGGGQYITVTALPDLAFLAFVIYVFALSRSVQIQPGARKCKR